MIRTQLVFRSDKFKDRSSDDTFHYRVFPGYTCFLEWNCFQDLSSDVLPFPSAAAIHLSPYFSRKTREIYGWPCYEARSPLPLKRGSNDTWLDLWLGFLLYSIPQLFIPSSLSRMEMKRSSDIYYSCASSKRKFPSNRFFRTISYEIV